MRSAFLFLFLFLGLTKALQRGFLYPHGRGVPDKILPPQDDVSSPELFLKTPIVFYNEVYSSVFVNSNGLISFITEVSKFFNLQFPLDFPAIAPLYSNVDVRGSGAVYYRETQEDVILDRATRTIRAAFSLDPDFQAVSALVVTWEDVGYHKQGVDKVNTFQAVVISNGDDSYVELLYPDHGIQWVQGSGQVDGLPDALAQAGFISVDGRMFTLKGSGSDQVRNLNEWSNTDNPGQWLFHVGRIPDGSNVGEPDLVERETEDSTAFCSSGFRTCHSRATCADFETGYCCVCQSGFFGNGKNCLSEVIPIRVNGKVAGRINSIELKDLDLQAYVVPTDGRTYTAISVVPPGVGHDMQSVTILGSTIGWLFARPVKGALNGYQLTGGIFNQTTTIRFPGTGETVTVVQNYTGLDVFQQLKMTGQIYGRVPVLSDSPKIVIEDYLEKYARVGLGHLRAQSTQMYRHENSDSSHASSETVQEIFFEDCEGTMPPASTMRLKSTRTFVSYEEKESIIRYAMNNRIAPVGVDEDPCADAASKCGAHSACVAERDSFTCVCNPGYQYGFSEAINNVTCVDLDECGTSLAECHEYATCINTQGSYHCRCNSGFSDDHGICNKILTCDDIQCDPTTAICVQRPNNPPRCLCKSGFVWDGTMCTSSDRNEPQEPPAQNPSPDHDDRPTMVAPECTILGCTCPEGYVIDYSETRCMLRRNEGDGFDESKNAAELARYQKYGVAGFDDLQFPEPICFDSDTCSCPSGYLFNFEHHVCQVNSTRLLETKGPTGKPSACAAEGLYCHQYARCVISSDTGRFGCECSPGLYGDGITTCDPYNNVPQQTPLDECTHPSDCVGEADCLPDSYGRLVCNCHPGYAKDPVTGTCHDEERRSATCLDLNNCHPDAQCVADRDPQNPVCRCNPGFEGDGYSCNLLETGCNILRNCAPFADCDYDESARGYRCKCRQGYHGDGHVCEPTKTCRDDASLCGEHASCQVDYDEGYFCQCNEGFVGNGQLCKPVSARLGNFLLVGQGMAILRVPFQPTSTDLGRPIVMLPYQQAIGIDTDCSENKVYWSDITGGNIYSADFNGQQLTTFIDKDIGSAEGLSIDWLSRNIFWTDSSRDTIEVASLDNSSLRKVIVSQGLVNPRGIAVHPSRGKIFWADWNREAPKIEWANMDGSDRQLFVMGPRVILPNSLTVDFSTDELCWADAGTYTVECMGIGNRFERTVVGNLSYPFGLTISQDHYYWTDWVSQKIERITRPGQQKEKPLLPPLGSSGKLYGIVAVSDSCPRLSNFCQQAHGRCGENHLCLPHGTLGRTCLCASPICAGLTE